MAKRVHLLCLSCGNARVVDFATVLDPPNTMRIEMDECNICEAGTGGWPSETYYDIHGNILECD